MAIIQTPDLLSPVNDMYGNTFTIEYGHWDIARFGTYSSFPNIPYSGDYKLILQLYARDVSATYSFSFISEELIPPRPPEYVGTGNVMSALTIYSPFQSLLASLSYELNPSLVSGDAPIKSILEYYIKWGVSYNPNFEITGVVDDGGYWGFSLADPSSALLAGTIVTIQSDNPYFSGTASVTSTYFTSPNTFKIDKIFTTASSISTGNITGIRYISSQSNNYFAYNGSRQYGEQNIDFNDVIVMGSSASSIAEEKPFITEYPLSLRKEIMLDQYENLSFFMNNSTFGVTTSSDNFDVFYDYYDSNNTYLGNSILAVTIPPNNTLSRWDIPVNTIGSFYATFSSYYTIRVANSVSGTVVKSETRYFSIDRSCSAYENVRVMWLNKYGAFEYYNFRLDDKKSYDISRTEFKKVLDYDYTTGDRQRTILGTKIVETHTINTNWVSEDIYEFLGTILTSPEVYVLIGNVPYPIIITDTNFEYKTVLRNRIFNMQLTYATSYDINTQQQ